jgi:hypothetical protein
MDSPEPSVTKKPSMLDYGGARIAVDIAFNQEGMLVSWNICHL